MRTESFRYDLGPLQTKPRATTLSAHSVAKIAVQTKSAYRVGGDAGAPLLQSPLLMLLPILLLTLILSVLMLMLSPLSLSLLPSRPLPARGRA